jgi:TRAP-type C4-dicarboxylate transport system permease small subunit
MILYSLLKIIHRTIRIFEEICLLIPMLVIIVLVILQVILRYGFDSGIQWSDEIIGFLMATVGMVGAAVAVREKKHTDLQVFVNMAPKPLAMLITGFASMVIAGFLLVFIIAGVQFVIGSEGQTAIMLDIPISIPYAVLPLGAFLMLYELILQKFKLVEEEHIETNDFL